MSLEAKEKHPRYAIDLADLPREITDWDRETYRELVATELTAAQRARIAEPAHVYEKQREVLAIHWHPEHVPLDLIEQRVDATFPGRETELMIPTQHNELVSYGPYTGVEVDCTSPAFHRKVQLLFHFATSDIEGRGDVFRSMLEHTRRYRASQLFEFIDSVLSPARADRVERAAEATGADEHLVEFVRIHVARLKALIDEYEAETPPAMIKNKLVRNYFYALEDEGFDARLLGHAQLFLKTVKKIVKERFPLDYFYESNEFIEEVRALGGCIVIPHPEQFWPILLEDLDVDGIEVWNPQSFQYTEFLIDVVHRTNRTFRRSGRPLLITMGDDCHMGEKVKDPRHQDPAKAGREIGVQPPWDDLMIRKRLIAANQSREKVIAQYRSRLG